MAGGRRPAVTERKGGRDVDGVGGWGSLENRRRASELLERASEDMLLRESGREGTVVAEVAGVEREAEVDADADADAQRFRVLRTRSLRALFTKLDRRALAWNLSMARYSSPVGLISERVEVWSLRMERIMSSAEGCRLGAVDARSGGLSDYGPNIRTWVQSLFVAANRPRRFMLCSRHRQVNGRFIGHAGRLWLLWRRDDQVQTRLNGAHWLGRGGAPRNVRTMKRQRRAEAVSKLEGHGESR